MLKKIFLTSLLTVYSLQATNHTIKFGVVNKSMDYREYSKDTNLILDSEKTDSKLLLGFMGDYTYKLPDMYNLNIRGEILEGETNYVGSKLSSNEGYGSYISTSTGLFTDFATSINFKKEIREKILVGGGIGIGYKYWQRGLSTSQIEDYYWNYYLQHFEMEYNINKKVLVRFQWELQNAISPKMSSSGVTSNVYDLGGVKTDIKKIIYEKKYKDNIYFIEGVKEREKITESNVLKSNIDGNYYYEPRSEQENYYIKLGIKIPFTIN